MSECLWSEIDFEIVWPLVIDIYKQFLTLCGRKGCLKGYLLWLNKSLTDPIV